MATALHTPRELVVAKIGRCNATGARSCEYRSARHARNTCQRFKNSNGWGYFTYGHHPEPYAESAAASPVTECAECHLANVAKTDMTYVQFYPLLRDKSALSVTSAR